MAHLSGEYQKVLQKTLANARTVLIEELFSISVKFISRYGSIMSQFVKFNNSPGKS